MESVIDLELLPPVVQAPRLEKHEDDYDQAKEYQAHGNVYLLGPTGRQDICQPGVYVVAENDFQQSEEVVLPQPPIMIIPRYHMESIRLNWSGLTLNWE